MYAILRAEKLGSGGEVGGSSMHATRERETLNADPSLRDQNRVVHGAADPAREIERRISELKAGGMKMRKDAVQAIELFLGASPEFFTMNPDRKEAFYEQSVDWLKSYFGADNVVSVIAHEDESTPHLSVFVIPLDKSEKKKVEGKKQRGSGIRLNAKRWTGSPGLMSKMQTSYADSLQGLGLQRGLEGSKAVHTDVKKFYGILARAKAMTGLDDALSALETVWSFARQQAELDKEIAKKLTQLNETKSAVKTLDFDVEAVKSVLNSKSTDAEVAKEQLKAMQDMLDQYKDNMLATDKNIKLAEAKLKKKNEKKISLGGQNLSLALTIKTTEKEITDKTKELEQLYDRLELLHETIYENKGELSKMQNEKTEIEKQIETSEDGLNKIKIKSNEAREQMYSEFNSRLVRKGDIIAGRCIEGFEIHGKHYAHIVTNESERFMPWSKEHYAKVIGKDISLRKDMEGKIQDFKVVSIVQTIQTGRPEPVEGPKIGGGGGMRMG